MSSKTKIVVFKARELIYTAIFAALAILLIVLLILMFKPQNKAKMPDPTSKSTYIPGVYTTSMKLADQTLNLVICVDADHINHIYLENLEEAVETLYPLVPTALSSLSSQILNTQSLDTVTYSASNQYTSQLLLNTITQTLEKALIP